MKKLLIVLVMSVLFMACGDPAAYKMTKKEFNDAYGKQVNELFKEQMRETLGDAMKGDKSKNEMKEEAEENFSNKLKEITGLTLEELKEQKVNWEEIRKMKPDGYEEMTIKEILDYK